jgi:hypothetical protein
VPTDKRFRNLNLAQKIILSWAISDDWSEKLDVASLFANQFFGQLGAGVPVSGQEGDKYDHRNVEFEEQSDMGRTTGKVKSSPMVREALNEFYEYKKSKTPVQRFVIGMDGEVSDPTDDTLG